MKKSDFSIREWQRILDEIREILIYQAGMNIPISYSGLCRKLYSRSLKPNDEALHTALGEISVSEHKAGRGFLSVYCGSVRGQHNMPKAGFFKMVNGLGVKYKKRSDFVKDEREKIHNYHRPIGILKM